MRCDVTRRTIGIYTAVISDCRGKAMFCQPYGSRAVALLRPPPVGGQERLWPHESADTVGACWFLT